MDVYKHTQLMNAGDDDDESDSDPEPSSSIPDLSETPEEMQASFERTIRERFTYGLLDVSKISAFMHRSPHIVCL